MIDSQKMFVDPPKHGLRFFSDGGLVSRVFSPEEKLAIQISPVPFLPTAGLATCKSAKIRAAVTATPDKSATEIAKELKVTPALVYNVKANMKKKAGKPKGKPGRKPGKKPSANGAASHSNHSAFDTAIEFIQKVGGLVHAEELIGKLKAIKERL